MKIRTDFVTNSSSSSFVVEIGIIDKNDKTYKYICNNTRYDYEEYYDESFKKSLKELSTTERALDFEIVYSSSGDLLKRRNETTNNMHIGEEVKLVKEGYSYNIYYNDIYMGHVYGSSIKNHYKSYLDGKYKCIVSYIERLSENKLNECSSRFYVTLCGVNEDKNSVLGASSIRDLCKLLCDNVSVPEHYCFDDYEDDDEEDEEVEDSVEVSKEKFIKDVVSNVKSLDDIKTIYFDRDYSAWGEGADLLADNDDGLVEFAHKVMNSTGDEQKKNIEEMKEYIKNVNLAEQNLSGYQFGNDFSIIKYSWDENDDILKLCERLVSNYGPDMVGGVEHSELNVKTGEVTEVATFTLN